MTEPRTPDEKQQLHDRIVTFFFQHVFALRVRATLPDGTPWSAVYTCFVLGVAGEWYLITAGHILEDLYEKLPKCTEVRCDLFDGWDEKRRLAAIPFNVLDAKHLHFDEDWLDIGIIRLEPLHRRNLETNQIRAFDEIGWHNPPTDMLAYAVIGLPDQLGNQPTIVFIEGVPTPPELEKLFPRFCGKLPDRLVHHTGESLTEMVGLSGGPIIGFTKPRPNGDIRYFLIAAQSAWLRQRRLLVGPLMEAVAHGIRAAFS